VFDDLFALTALPNLHPALVHFPIALSVVALLFEAAVWVRWYSAPADRCAAVLWILAAAVMIHQFWGHKYESGMKTSRSQPGENVNLLHDDCVRDRFTGMPVFNGTPCRVEAI